ncbi:MAG: endonuclease, partial [Roseibium sp.]
FNCEHVVPQSWFKDQAERRAQKSDLHHLFTCESDCNSFRSNIPYSEFSDVEEATIIAAEIAAELALADPTLEAARPQCGLRDKRRFEPSAGKGAAARATLYFTLRYPGAVGDVKTGSKSEFVKSNVETLLIWAEQEPPSLHEQHRNAEIAKVQGNRNPLIDHPEWLRKIDFQKGFG